mmetsp:Transcript_1766/g.4490  ORF Transcript_1766/g.4490 Transcript_1766/m.4490 type:complete len:219 (-) Transcript_1766:85-741(-)
MWQNSGTYSLVICDGDTEFCDAAKNAFATLECKVVCGLLEQQLECDGVVWPGNCHGLLTSGIDRAMSAWLGPEVLNEVRHQIDIMHGDAGMPPGATVTVNLQALGCLTGKDPPGNVRHVIYVAVFPKSMGIAKLAMTKVLEAAGLLSSPQEERGALGAAAATMPPCSLACPGLGTFRGSMDVAEVARMMADAVRAFSGQEVTAPANSASSASASAGSA